MPRKYGSVFDNLAFYRTGTLRPSGSSLLFSQASWKSDLRMDQQKSLAKGMLDW